MIKIEEKLPVRNVLKYVEKLKDQLKSEKNKERFI
jgi:hypothetical protein